MATTLDPASFHASDPIAADDVAAGAWRRIALVVLVALLACTIGAWLGYRRHVSAAPVAPLNSTASSTLRPAAPGDDRLARGLSAGEEIVIDSAPGGPQSGLQWPLWEFRLRQPIPPREPSLTPPTWRLIGSALSGGKWAVIVLRQGSTTPEYFMVGQELPGGYRIESISDDDVTLAQGKRLMVLSYIGSR